MRLHCDRIGNGSLTKDASIKLDNQKASIVKKNQTAVVTKSPGLGVKIIIVIIILRCLYRNKEQLTRGFPGGFI